MIFTTIFFTVAAAIPAIIILWHLIYDWFELKPWAESWQKSTWETFKRYVTALNYPLISINLVILLALLSLYEGIGVL